jgi:CrcB protein
VITVVAFVAAAATGALARAEAGRRWNQPAGFPTGTLIVNVTGAFLLGLLADVAPPVITVIGTGGLGAYTTFSSFGRDAVALVEDERAGLAVAYVALTCLLGIGAAALGIAV